MQLNQSIELPSSNNSFSNAQISTDELKSYLDRIDSVLIEIDNESPEWILLNNNPNFRLFSHTFLPNKTIKKIPFLYFNPTNRQQTEYIVIGTIDDVNSHDFMTVQTDIAVRKRWDKYIKKLDLINYDEETRTQLINWIVFNPVYLKIFNVVSIAKSLSNGFKFAILYYEEIDDDRIIYSFNFASKSDPNHLILSCTEID
ncbi:hypothetical protein HZS_1125 [Henneguya salminicola]|nr:hypothetical protein HZS_1125 [Henneguya salminicola]